MLDDDMHIGVVGDFDNGVTIQAVDERDRLQHIRLTSYQTEKLMERLNTIRGWPDPVRSKPRSNAADIAIYAFMAGLLVILGVGQMRYSQHLANIETAIDTILHRQAGR